MPTWGFLANQALVLLRQRRDSRWQHSGKLLQILSCQDIVVLLNVSHWRRSLSGFRRVHALGDVSRTPPVMTRTMALHG
jgi:hypothetical protein